jgi:1-phosphofructokinase family hexose kinase
MTIHCVTPNPAVDVTYRLDAVTMHAVNRVHEVTRRPGGKGVNVARLLAARCRDVAAYGFLGGSPGQLLCDLLAALQPDVHQRWTTTAAETRITIAVVDDQDTTMFNEPGRPVRGEDWDQLTQALTTQCHPGDTVTISGSLPAGSTAQQLAWLVAAACEAGASVIVDASGPALVAAAKAGAHVLKPNQHELLEITGTTDVRTGIDTLLVAGAEAVVASFGAEGLILGTRHGSWTAALGQSLTGNPTGAGDALVAALANGLTGSIPEDLSTALAEALPSAIAWSAAAVLSPVAGEIDQQIAEEFVRRVTMKEL